MLRLSSLLAVCTSVALTGSLASQHEYAPAVEKAPENISSGADRLVPFEGLTARLVAAEPHLANPVAFDLTPDGRFFVVETFRLRAGVIDMGGYRDWLYDDLTCETVADRVVQIRKHFGPTLTDWTKEYERVRTLLDDDQDGVVDRTTDFEYRAFGGLAAGIAAGVLVDGDRVYTTSIPGVFVSTDADRDGKADDTQKWFDGFGVHFSLIGHDLHGLVIGPDRRLYFSIGDRGFDVTTKEGERLSYPDEGAVLRCELDGSNLEVVHRGLRNPQELAFDDLGTLWTGDNNSDGGDQARLVHILPGADSGWRIGFQWLGDRGAWKNENLWKPPHAGQPDFVMPPIRNVGNGPSGIAFDPGGYLPGPLAGRLLWCDFRGSARSSGVLALELKPKGSTYELVDEQRLVWNVLNTDVAFGYDGDVYLSDWVRGWGKTGRGRIYALHHEAGAPAPGPQRADTILNGDLGARSISELTALLSHRDRRVRQAVQFELVDRSAREILEGVASSGRSKFARLHAVWGLSILARNGDQAAAQSLVPLVIDQDPDLRAQAVRGIGEARYARAIDILFSATIDADLRVQREAAIALGNMRDSRAVEALGRVADRAIDDPWLRHAAAYGLAHSDDNNRAQHEARLAGEIANPSVGIRLACVLALRQIGSKAVVAFLDDVDPRVAAASARAIHALDLRQYWPILAAKLKAFDVSNEAVIWRAIEAQRRLGALENLKDLLEFLTRDDASDKMRRFAFEAIQSWPETSRQDRINGRIFPSERRSRFLLQGLLRLQTSEVLPRIDGDLARRYVKLLADLKLDSTAPDLRQFALRTDKDGGARALALEAFSRLGEPTEATLRETAAAIPADAPPAVLRAASNLLVTLDPVAAIPKLRNLAFEGSVPDRRFAIESLAQLGGEAADAALLELVGKVTELPAQVQEDVLAMAESREGPLKDAVDAYFAGVDTEADSLALWTTALNGGNRDNGERLFREHPSAQCIKCHKIGGEGGEAGPVLDRIGRRVDRRYLLRSMIEPSAEHAAGWAVVTLKLKDDSTVTGTLLDENEQRLRLRIGDQEREVAVAQVVERTTAPSAMPVMAPLLTRSEARDLVEYLARTR